MTCRKSLCVIRLYKQLHRCRCIHSLYRPTVCGKKVSPKVFCHFLSKRSEFLHEISHIYYSFIITYNCSATLYYFLWHTVDHDVFVGPVCCTVASWMKQLCNCTRVSSVLSVCCLSYVNVINATHVACQFLQCHNIPSCVTAGCWNCFFVVVKCWTDDAIVKLRISCSVWRRRRLRATGWNETTTRRFEEQAELWWRGHTNSRNAICFTCNTCNKYLQQQKTVALWQLDVLFCFAVYIRKRLWEC